MDKQLIKCEVATTDVDTRSGTSNRTNKEYEISTQEAWFHLPNDRYPSRVLMNLEDKNRPYPAGTYYVDVLEMLQVGGFSQLELNTRKMKLVPAQASAQKAS